jgi:hypothetical protein
MRNLRFSFGRSSRINCLHGNNSGSLH